MPNWTVDIASAGAAFAEYPKALPVTLFERLNGVGFFTAWVFDSESNPGAARDQLIRFTWDKGGAEQQVHYEGVITDVRRHPELSVVTRLRGFDVNGLLWQLGIGGVREWVQQEPHDIIQGAGPPDPLIKGAQGLKRDVGGTGTTVDYGTDAGVPWKVTATNPGLAMDFRADSSRSWLNIQRLLLQGRGTQAEYPAWAEDHPDGSTDLYGLEAFCRIEEPGGVTQPVVYLVSRKERSADAAPVTIAVPSELPKARRGVEGLTAAEAIRVIGSGAGKQRVESSLIGSGGLEGIVPDKTIVGSAEAENQAHRLAQLLDPTVEVATGWYVDHDHAFRVGDRVTLQESGQADSTLRVFARGYRMMNNKFFLVMGRPRPMADDPFSELSSLAGGHAQGTQRMSGEKVGSWDQDDLGVADGSGITQIVVTPSRTMPVAVADAVAIQISLNVDAGAEVDLLIQLVDSSVPAGVSVFDGRVKAIQAGAIVRDIFVAEAIIGNVASLDVIDQLEIDVTNRSGATMDINTNGALYFID